MKKDIEKGYVEYTVEAGDNVSISDIIKFPENYVVDIIAVPSVFSGLDDFYDSTVPIYNIDFPLVGYHACPHAAMSKFSEFRKWEDQENHIIIIYGRTHGTNIWDEVIDYFPVNDWDSEGARESCRMGGGVAFVPANTGLGDSGDFTFRVQKKSNDRQLVYGIVLEPNKVDLQGDIMTPEEIEKAAHRYMEYMFDNSPISMIGAEHERPIMAIPVESFIAPVDFWYEGTPQTDDYKVPKGAWVLVAHINDPVEFAKVKMGEYTGYSIQGRGIRINAQ